MLVALLSFALMLLDSRFNKLEPVRYYLSVILTPVHWVVSVPVRVANWAGGASRGIESMQAELETLRAQNLVMQRQLLQVGALNTENARLRELLNASERLRHRVLAAELIGVDPNPYTHHAIVNKGEVDGVYLGQPVLDGHGVLGQVVEVSRLYSRVLLAADGEHATPVQVNRNGVRAIAIGTGQLDELELMYVPNTANIQEGDLLVTSGLGGRFPAGYPVGKVTSVIYDSGQPFAIVKAVPSAQLDRSRHVMLAFVEGTELAQNGEGVQP